MSLKAFIQKHALPIYFFLAYGIVWSLLLLIMASIQFQTSEVDLQIISLMLLAMAAGPSIAGLTLTAILEGKAGVRELFSRIGHWRVEWGWYLAAMGITPVVLLTILTVLSRFNPVFQPGWMPLGLLIGAFAGFFEELGWTGFALPRLLKRTTGLKASLILGLLWAFWHMMADYLGNIQTMGNLWFINFLVYWIIPLTAYRILIAWAYQNTNSLLIAQIMHMFYTGTLIMLTPTTSLNDALVWESVFGVSLWLVVGIVVSVYGSTLVRKTLKKALAQ